MQVRRRRNNLRSPVRGFASSSTSAQETDSPQPNAVELSMMDIDALVTLDRAMSALGQ